VKIFGIKESQRIRVLAVRSCQR